MYIDKTYLSSSGHSDRCDPWSFFTDPYHHMSGLLMNFLFEKNKQKLLGRGLIPYEDQLSKKKTLYNPVFVSSHEQWS